MRRAPSIAAMPTDEHPDLHPLPEWSDKAVPPGSVDRKGVLQLPRFWQSLHRAATTTAGDKMYTDPVSRILELPEGMRQRCHRWVRATETIAKSKGRPPTAESGAKQKRGQQSEQPAEYRVVQPLFHSASRVLVRPLEGVHGLDYAPEAQLMASQLELIGNNPSSVAPGSYLWENIWYRTAVPLAPSTHDAPAALFDRPQHARHTRRPAVREPMRPPHPPAFLAASARPNCVPACGRLCTGLAPRCC